MSVELGTGNTSQNIRRFAISELEQATRNFSESNVIGEGRFGLAYKGLLQDGSIVAIKRRQYVLTQSFIPQVKLRKKCLCVPNSSVSSNFAKIYR